MTVDHSAVAPVTARRPRVLVFPDEAAVARALARRIAAAIEANPSIVLGLPTGRTPLALYRELGVLHAGGSDFSGVTTFNLDEFLGIPPSHPGSYRSFMEQHLFRHVNIPTERHNFLDGGAADPERECVRYERAIAAAGGIDLQVLGIGTNGHIGFNEPARELQARTHRVTLKPETRRSNAALFGGDPA
jgi:glucosamine-6-phosphate deaminase